MGEVMGELPPAALDRTGVVELRPATAAGSRPVPSCPGSPGSRGSRGLSGSSGLVAIGGIP